MSAQIATVEQNGDLMVPAVYDHIMKLAETCSKADFVPDHCKGKPANCLIILEMGHRLGIPAMMALQSIHVVHGKPGMASTLAIALVNTAGLLRGPLRYEYVLDDKGQEDICTAWGIDRETGERLEATFSFAEATQEGYVGRNPKYKTMRRTMMTYRAATRFARFYCPQRLMGLQTTDEVEDIYGAASFHAEVRPASNGLAAQLLESNVQVIPSTLVVEPEPVKEPETAKPRKSKQAAAEPAPAAVVAEEEKAVVLQVEGTTEEEILASFKKLPADAKARFKEIAKAEKESGNYLLADGTTIDEAAIFVAAKNLFNAQEAFK